MRRQAKNCCCFPTRTWRARRRTHPRVPIFVRRTATGTGVFVNEVPDQQRRRLLSVRAYDSGQQMVDADVAPGTELTSLIDRFFSQPEVAYLHVHNARRGCYACRVDRRR